MISHAWFFLTVKFVRREMLARDYSDDMECAKTTTEQEGCGCFVRNDQKMNYFALLHLPFSLDEHVRYHNGREIPSSKNLSRVTSGINLPSSRPVCEKV